MSEMRCSCAAFEKLEGASVPAYIKAFLDQEKSETDDGRDLYRCRDCGRVWERRAPEKSSEGKRPSLLHLTGG